MNQKIMLIDGHSIINRAFYGVPLLSNAEGIYTNGVFGFLNILFKLIEEEKPEFIGVAFDLSAPTFRHKQYEAYKGTRKGMPDELRMQVPILKEVLQTMGIQRFEMEGYEADDLLGTLAVQAESQGIQPVIISGDRDLLQLATDTIKVRIPKTKQGKTEIEDYYAADVQMKYGVTPKEFIDVKALMGDPSDNIPGVPSIGEKTATKIIQQYHTLEEAIIHKKEITPKRASRNLETFEAQAILSKQLATICIHVPITLNYEALKMPVFSTAEVYALFKKLEFKSLLEKIKPQNEEVGGTLVQDLSPYIYTSIRTIEEYHSLLKELVQVKVFSYVIFEEEGLLIGISFSYDTQIGVWVEAGDLLTAQDIIIGAKELWQSDDIKKITHQLKESIHFFRKYEVDLRGVFFDTMIAGYVLNPSRDSYHYDDLAREYLKENIASVEEILGKGKSKKSLCGLVKEEATIFAASQAHILLRVKEVMEQKIRENHQEKLFYDIEMPLAEVLADMEMHGFKVDIDKLRDYSKELEYRIDILTEDIYQMAGEQFNINSTKQLGVILFEKIGLTSEKKTKTGYSTAAEVLEKLSKKHPIVRNILEYRQLVKLKSTYADGLAAVMDPKTHKIFSTFHQTITVTGRISSTEPNLQNIPIKLSLGREIRKMFIPTNEEYILLDADYSQIELRVLAHMSQDQVLIQAFKNNEDIHRLTASQVLKIPLEEVTSQQRSNAKAVNFGIIYGIGAFSLSQDLNITRKEAERYIEGYFEKYPKVKVFMDEVIEEAKKNGYVTTLFDRRRLLPELQSQNFVQRSFGERAAMNTPIQGSAADIIKIAMIRVHTQLKQRGLRSRLILQVHDELLIEAHKEELSEVQDILRYEMENAVKLVVPLEIDMHTGNTWYETK